MAYLRNHPQSKYWIACFRDSMARVCNRSTKILIAPPGESPRERATLASKNRKLAQAVADAFEETARANTTEAQLRKVLADLSERADSRGVEFATSEARRHDWR